MTRTRQLISSPATWFCGYLLWFVVLFLLSSISPENPGKVEVPHLDKVAHASYFTLGSAVLGVGILLVRRGIPRRRLLLLLVGAALVVGGFDEWHQTHTAGRSGNDLGDLSADGLGGVLGFFVAGWLFGFAERRGLAAKLPA